MRFAIILGATTFVGAAAVHQERTGAVEPRLTVALDAGRALIARDSDLTERERLLHVAHRLGFGPRPGQIEAMQRMGLVRWIDQQLNPEKLADAPGDRLSASYQHLRKSPAQLAREFPPANAALRAARNAQGSMIDSAALRREARERRVVDVELMSSRLARAVASERQLNEVMVDFWLNHFNVFIGKNQRMRYAIPSFEYDAIRPHALGDFRELLGAVAHSSAMLIYLDNAQSVADSGRQTTAGGLPAAQRRRAQQRMTPEQQQRAAQIAARRPKGLNENYARELLELHTLGADGGYTQQDVIEVARALTGWGVVPPGLSNVAVMQNNRARRVAPRMVIDGDFLFNPTTHDAGEKTVLGVKLPAGRGVEDGEQVLNIIAAHPATARHIARKLCVRFISDEPPASIVDRAADTFTRTRGDIREVLRTIVTSPEFFSRDAYKAKVKSPFELIASSVRALGGAADTTMFTAALAARLGQPIYGRQTPDGWPETGTEWMNTGAILNRINLGMFFASGRLPGTGVANTPRFSELQGSPKDVQINAVVDLLLGGDVSSETRAIMLSGENPLMRGADTDVNTNMRRTGQGPTERRGRAAQLQLGANRPLSTLEQLVGLALGSPEFQRR